jgi:hypothetical protein
MNDRTNIETSGLQTRVRLPLGVLEDKKKIVMNTE